MPLTCNCKILISNQLNKKTHRHIYRGKVNASVCACGLCGILSSLAKAKVNQKFLQTYEKIGNFRRNTCGFSGIGFQMQQDKCDIVRAGQDNTQRIIDTLNSHWQADLQQRYNDARLELSQQKQNAELIAALKPTATTAGA